MAQVTLVSGTQENAQRAARRVSTKEGANKVGHRQALIIKIPSA